jgi:HEAT repeat protein
MILYCLQGWAENPPTATVCGRCRSALDAAASYDTGLIAALRHPEAATPVRAAWLLGERHVQAAIESLREVLRCSGDPYLLEAACIALEQIGLKSAEPELLAMLRSGPLLARRAAAQALGALDTPDALAALKRTAEEDSNRSVRDAARYELDKHTDCESARPGAD